MLAHRRRPAALLLGVWACGLPLASAGLFSGWFTGSSAGPVAVLTSANFASHVRDNPRTLVKFYAPWCGHCKTLAPHFEEAAGQLRPAGVSLAKVDATENKDVATEFGVESYPTLVWLADGDRIEYSGERTAAGIVEWVKAMTGPPVLETSAPPEPEKLPRVVLRGPSLLDGFAAAAKANRTKAAWFFVKDAGVPRVELQHPGEEPVELTEGVGEKEKVMAFFKENEVPLFGPLNGDTFARYSGRSLVWSLFPVDTKPDGLKATEAKWRPVMVQVAKRFAGKHSVTYTDTNAFKDQIDSMLGVKEFPAIVLQPSAGSKTKYIHRGEMTAEAIIQFLEDVDAGKVEPTLKSEPVPKEDDGPVKIIVGSTLAQEVFTEDQDVVLEIYAPWCGSCKKFWPEYRKLGVYVKNMELSHLIKVAKIDGTANDIVPESLAYTSFPTVYFIPAGQTPIKFDGERTSKGLWQWIKQRTTKGEAIKEIQAKAKSKKGSQEL